MMKGASLLIFYVLTSQAVAEIAVVLEGTLRRRNFSTQKMYSLECDIKGNPSYRWTASLTNVSSLFSRTLHLKNNTHKNGKTEKLGCFGTIKSGFKTESVNITWFIQWTNEDEDVVYGGPEYALEVAAGGLAAGIILTITICCLLIWKKAGSRLITRTAVSPTKNRPKFNQRNTKTTIGLSGR